MKKGQIVRIYQKPITKEEYEGQAKLIKRESSTRDSDMLENWRVEFIDDGFKCERLVNIDAL